MAWFLNTGSIKLKLWSLHFSFFAYCKLILNYAQAYFTLYPYFHPLYLLSFTLMETKLIGTVYPFMLYMSDKFLYQNQQQTPDTSHFTLVIDQYIPARPSGNFIW